MSLPDNLLDRLAATAAESTGSEVVIVMTTDIQTSSLKLVGGFNLNTRGIVGTVIPLSDDAFCSDVISKRSESTLHDFARLSHCLRSIMQSSGIRIITGIPILGVLGAEGVILFGSRSGLARGVMPTARALASIALTCYQRDQMFAEVIHEAHDLKWLASITEKIRLEEGRSQVVASVLEAGGEVLDADAMALYLLDEDQNKLDCVAADGLPVSIIDAKTKKQQNALMEALSLQNPLVIPDLQLLPGQSPFKQLVLDVNIRSVLGLQLRHRGWPMGLLVALYKRPDAAAERRMELCRMLATDAAVALNYSRLLEQTRSLVHDLEIANERLEQQAIHDGLTGLANHRTFHQRLTEYIHKVGRYGESFSIAMLDVDHFKAYNDAYGHQEGDLALQQIAKIISREVRESDFAARYGGEEFAIILPHTPKSHGRIALERIRKAIDSYQFPNGKLTISAGIAECPLDGTIVNEVLEKADRSLYHAKLTGRNRICLWAAPSDDQNRRDSMDGRNVSVLIVENSHEARLALENALKLANYDLCKASSTNEAMELLRTRKFDVMLSDSLILGTEGLQVLGLASSIHPMMPIVLTTAPSMANQAKEAMQHGVTDLVVEPFNEHEIPVVIERNLERKRLERQMLLQKSTGILLQAIDALVAAIDAKDRMTAGHTTKVTHLSLAMADTLGLPSEERYTLELAARLHDIGKLSLPDSALNKSGQLSEEEWAAMQRHPAVGSQIVGSIEELSYIATIVRHHHERLDGRGYPDGLQGEAIPFLSRIIAVADAFEAMTSERSYRQKKTTDEAIVELRKCIGTHYSSDIVEALVESLRIGSIEGQGLDNAA